jgi:hypothetical protein
MMSEKVWVTLIVAVTVLFVVLMLRRQLRSLFLKGLGFHAEVQTHNVDSVVRSEDQSAGKSASVKISNFKQTGSRNVLDVKRDDVAVEKTTQKGLGHQINVGSDKSEQK